MPFSTPLYHLTEDDKNYVYDPAEDSFLLLDALEKDFEELRRSDPIVVVEVGCGSGIISAFLLQILKSPLFLLATDLNLRALKSSKLTARLNHVNFELVLCDLVLPLNERLQHTVDILIFNPPYVNTDEYPTSDLAYSWAGGPTGSHVLDRLMLLAPKVLSNSGVMYIVASKSNKISHILKSSPSLFGEIVLERRCGCEHLFIIKFRKVQS